MKKILLVALLVLLPMSVYALEPMADGNLDEITAQEGVQITISGNGSYTDPDTSVEVMSNALEIQQKAVSTAWTNRDGNIESGIVMKVTQTDADKIFVSGDLTIQAKTSAGPGFVSSVEIGLPEVYMTKGSKKTEIYVTSRTSETSGVNHSKDLDDSNFISDVTTPVAPATVAPGKLGTQYTNAGYTHIVSGGKISITSMP